MFSIVRRKQRNNKTKLISSWLSVQILISALTCICFSLARFVSHFEINVCGRQESFLLLDRCRHIGQRNAIHLLFMPSLYKMVVKCGVPGHTKRYETIGLLSPAWTGTAVRNTSEYVLTIYYSGITDNMAPKMAAQIQMRIRFWTIKIKIII